MANLALQSTLGGYPLLGSGAPGGSLTLLALATPAAPVATLGTSGTVGANLVASTAYAYSASAVAGDGTESPASPTASVTQGTTAYPVSLALNAVAGAASYNVYRNGGLLLNTPSLAVQDTGAVTPNTSTPPPTANTTAGLAAPALTSSGLAGAQSPTRYAGGTAGVAPTTGTFLAGDYVVDATSETLWICTVAGSPGTWVQASPALNSTLLRTGDVIGINLGNPNLWTSLQTFSAGLEMSAGTFSLGTAGTTGYVTANLTASNPWFGLYNASTSLYYGIFAGLPAPAGVTGLGAYYHGMGIGGTSNGTGTPIFAVLTNTQGGAGIGATAFGVTDSNVVSTYHNTLDGGAGEQTVAGLATFEAGVAVTAPGAAGTYTWNYNTTTQSLDLVYAS